MKRRHISWKTKCASLLLQLGDIPYKHAKQMTKDQIISLYHCDHNILHETEHEDRDEFWNLTHRLIHQHREKTKVDAKIIAKSRRLRAKYMPNDLTEKGLTEIIKRMPRMKISGWDAKRTIRSRGFDKTLRKKVNGRVEKR